MNADEADARATAITTAFGGPPRRGSHGAPRSAVALGSAPSASSSAPPLSLCPRSHLARWSPGERDGYVGSRGRLISWIMPLDHLVEEQLTHAVIGAFYEVYNTLGFGFLEHVYLSALERELRARGYAVGREVYVPVLYKGEELARQRIDMIVDEQVLVEAKSTHELHKSAKRQLYNYLRATRLQAGLLLHFGPEPCFYRLVSSRSGDRASKQRSLSGHQEGRADA